MRIGLRIWKTGIATSVTLLITAIFTQLDPLLAVVTAILSLQPSVAASIKRGWSRIQATVIGAIIGISLSYVGLHVLNLGPAFVIFAGLGVVLSIVASNKLKIQDGAVIGAIAVVATMVDITDSILASGAYRLISTLVGIGVASVVNLIFIPPQYRPVLIQEIKSLNENIVALYRDSVHQFISCCQSELPKNLLQVEHLKEQLEFTKEHLSYYKDELGYRRYLTNLSPAIVKEVVIFEKTIKTLDLILDRTLDITRTTESRVSRRSGENKINIEYGKLLFPLENMTEVVNDMQTNIINLLDTFSKAEENIITDQIDKINLLKSELHQSLNAWHFNHKTEDNFISLMEISKVVYDIEQTAEYLRRLAKKLISVNHKEFQSKQID